LILITRYKTADIAVAVATENGLITPIVRSAEAKGLASISNSVKELAEKARSGKLTPNEYQVCNKDLMNIGGILYYFKLGNVRHSTFYCNN
jgi:pyruvate dehydrogenase E2 component (dihydrolipoamide acetyltransferase)